MVGVLVIVLLLGVACEGKLVSTCSDDEFPCNDGSCIKKTLWCDSEVNCKDHSDENFCFFSSSLRPNPNNCDKTTFFTCKDGPCIPLVGRCDGSSSCRDGSDEEGCLTEKETTSDFTSSIVTEDSSTGFPGTLHLHEMTEEGLAQVNTARFADKAQADSGSSDIRTKDNLEKGFKDIDTRHFKQQRALAHKWLLSVRDEDYGWGVETPRALVALYLSEDLVLNLHDKMLMSKQLHVQLFTALIRNRTMEIPLWELSLFINALSASCDDPTNFYGQNLLEILRLRTDAAEKSSIFVTPLVYLTLCLHDATTYSDIVKVLAILNYNTSKIDKSDIEALVSLTATCISRIPKFSSFQATREVSTALYSKILKRGFPDNIYKLALVTQALNEARFNQNKWNRSEALNLITSQQDNGSFGDILSTYYALPILSGRSLLSIGSNCEYKNKDQTQMEMLRNGDAKEIYIKYSLYFRDPPEVSHTLMLKVKNQTTFLDIMKMAAVINPVYNFRYDMTEGKPGVYSIGGVVNDPERGLYWQFYVASGHKSNGTSFSPYEEDIRNFKLHREDSIVFWFKSL